MGGAEADGEPRGQRISLDVAVPREQLEWLDEMAAHSHQSRDELVWQAIELLRKATAYRSELAQRPSRSEDQ